MMCSRKAEVAPPLIENVKPGAGTAWPEGRGAGAPKSSKIMGFLENLMLCTKIVGLVLLVKKKF